MLLVDFQSLSAAVSSGARGEDQGADLRGLFRDAEMNDAVIFFDECEAIFAQVRPISAYLSREHCEF